MKFRKRPVVINAIQWTGDNYGNVMKWALRETGETPMRLGTLMNDNSKLLIETLEGRMEASPGDWIICGVEKELYPCKPDIFAKTYEPVSEGVENALQD